MSEALNKLVKQSESYLQEYGDSYEGIGRFKDEQTRCYIVNWKRDDLFHVPFDQMAKFISERLTRHFTIRHDYRLYEYTVYVYR